MTSLSSKSTPLVAVIMGSKSDWSTMQHTTELLAELEVPYEAKVVSAHRTPDLLFEYVGGAAARGVQVIIAGAGCAALLAAAILAIRDPALQERLGAYRLRQTTAVLGQTL